jgi:hypothetical protein
MKYCILANSYKYYCNAKFNVVFDLINMLLFLAFEFYLIV